VVNIYTAGFNTNKIANGVQICPRRSLCSEYHTVSLHTHTSEFHVRLKGKKALPELIFTKHRHIQQHCVVCLRLGSNYVYHQP